MDQEAGSPRDERLPAVRDGNSAGGEALQSLHDAARMRQCCAVSDFWLVTGSLHGVLPAGMRAATFKNKLRNEHRFASGLRSFLLLVGFEMRAQAVDHDVFVSFLHLFFYFFQCEVLDVVVLPYQACYRVAEN